MWQVVESKKRIVEALHNIAGSVRAGQRNYSEKISIEAVEVAPPVVPIGGERQEMVPIVDQGIDRQQAAFAAMNLPRGLALVEENFQAEQRDYTCHNSYKLLPQVAVAYHNAGSVVPVGPRTADTLRTYYKISPLKATTR